MVVKQLNRVCAIQMEQKVGQAHVVLDKVKQKVGWKEDVLQKLVHMYQEVYKCPRNELDYQLSVQFHEVLWRLVRQEYVVALQAAHEQEKKVVAYQDVRMALQYGLVLGDQYQVELPVEVYQMVLQIEQNLVLLLELLVLGRSVLVPVLQEEPVLVIEEFVLEEQPGLMTEELVLEEQAILVTEEFVLETRQE